MCGRYTLHTPGETVAEIFDVTESVELAPRYNIAPTQEVAVVGLSHQGNRSLGFMRWGLIPSWAKDPSIGNRLINARSESAAEKPAFRSSFKKRRCLVPADGFYEWKKVGDGKQPHYLRMKTGAPFAIAGLWARWHGGEGDPVQSCTLLTTTPNEVAGAIHDRMPVILPAAAYSSWLDPETPPEALQELLVPYPAEEMEAYPVHPMVGNPRNDTPKCIEPLPPR
ncbi:MAG: SOS response-associated peptidase [Acidobacteria bacterium]|nr:SOS response-associated peptidase [Acidobacteriota bacterium]